MTEQKRNSMFRIIVVLLVIPLFPAALNVLFSPNRPAWNPLRLAEDEVSVEMALNWQEPFLFVDARSPSQYEVDHVSGSLNLSETYFDDQIPALLNQWHPDLTLIIYCDSRQCNSSKVIAERLRENFQMEHVYVLKGGWESWETKRKVFNL